VLLVTGARLGDRFGRRRLFVLGALGFAAASAWCAVAPTVGVLVAGRIVQGAFGALMIPQGFGVLTTVFAEHERARGFGLFGPVMGVASVGGSILAGGLIALDVLGLGWRTVFLVTVPIGLAAAAGALAWMPADAGDRGVRLDPVGALLVALGSGLLIHPLIQGPDAGWPWWTGAEVVAALVAFAALARRQRTSPSPILVPTLLRRPVFVSGLVTAVAFFAGVGGLLLLLSPHGLVAGALAVAAAGGVCAALVLLLPRRLSPTPESVPDPTPTTSEVPA
jgi:MFS family permease